MRFRAYSVKKILDNMAVGLAWALWLLVPLLAILFTCAAGRGWPLHVGPDFPKAGNHSARPEVKAADLLVYSPDVRTMFLQAELQVDAPGKQPSLQILTTHGKETETSTVETRFTGKAGLIKATAPLRLKQGINALHLTLGASSFDSTAFFVESVRITQNIFSLGNLLFCLTLTAVAVSSILAAHCIGANGLHAFCAASLIGFLLVTFSATLLSPFHLLTGGTWAGVLMASALALGAASVFRLRKHSAAKPTPENTLRPLEGIVLLALVCPVFVMHILAPITHWDDLMYHGPRTGYWMENASALPFPSPNDRMSTFPIGGDLLNACGTIISGSELPGKFLVGLSFPLILFAMLALLKNTGLRASVSLGITVVFATAPIIISNAVGIKPDLWLVLFGILALHWVLTARRGDSIIPLTIVSCLAAASVGASFGIKWTGAPLILLLPFALFVPGWKQRPAERLLPAAGAFVVALALGGAGPNLLFNLRTSHHPFGSKAMRDWHQPDPGMHPAMVQIERLPFILFALPYVPGETMRNVIERWEIAAADEIGATERLRKERGSGWPGLFLPQVKKVDDRFSLGWFFIVLGVAGGIYAFRRRVDREKRFSLLLISGLSLTLTVAVVTQIRWQASSGVPDRFLLPAFAFGLISIGWPADRLMAGGKLPAALLSALVGLHMLPYCTLVALPFRFGAGNGWQAPASVRTDSEFDAISRLLPPGRTILLLGNQESRDYPLFLAREGFANRVQPWGKAVYEPAAFERALRQPGVDTVILMSTDLMDLTWDTPLDMRPFVQDLDSRADFGRLPGTGNVVVYVRKAPAS